MYAERSSVQTKKCAVTHTITSKSFTIQKNTRQSSVQALQPAQVSANMASIVHLRITRRKFRLTWLTNLNETKIFTCSTSRQCGVLIASKRMSATLACMHTTGKITGANRSNTNSNFKYVKTGTKNQPLKSIQTLVRMDFSAKSRTGGKRTYSIPMCTRCIHVPQSKNAKTNIVLTIIARTRNGNLCWSGLSFFRGVGLSFSLQHITQSHFWINANLNGVLVL